MNVPHNAMHVNLKVSLYLGGGGWVRVYFQVNVHNIVAVVM